MEALYNGVQQSRTKNSDLETKALLTSRLQRSAAVPYSMTSFKPLSRLVCFLDAPQHSCCSIELATFSSSLFHTQARSSPFDPKVRKRGQARLLKEDDIGIACISALHSR